MTLLFFNKEEVVVVTIIAVVVVVVAVVALAVAVVVVERAPLHSHAGVDGAACIVLRDSCSIPSLFYYYVHCSITGTSIALF